MKSSASDRLACVDLPALALQLLLQRHPEWRAYPAAVVAEDKPQGLILQINERARRCGVLSGLRYAAAFSLARGLRAGEVVKLELNDLDWRQIDFKQFSKKYNADLKNYDFTLTDLLHNKEPQTGSKL